MLSEMKKYKEMGFACFSVDIKQRETGGKWKKEVKFPYGWAKFTTDTKYYNEEYNGVAIITGEVSGVFVIDIDNVDHWNELLEIEGKEEPATVKAISGSGGIHLYFEYTEDLEEISNTSRCIRDYDIDVRSNGGCIIAPPTSYFNKNTEKKATYKWVASPHDYELNKLPTWLKKILLEKKDKKENKKEVKKIIKKETKTKEKSDSDDEEENDENETAGTEEDEKNDVLNEVGVTERTTDDTLKKLLNGLNTKRWKNYEDWKNIGMVFVNEGYNLSIFDDFSKKSKEKYDRDQNEKIINGFKCKKNGLTVSTLYAMLKEDNIKLFRELNKERCDLWNLLKNLNQNELAKLYYNLFPEKYVRSKQDGWYEYAPNDTLIYAGNTPSSILNSISNVLQDLILELRNSLKPTDKYYKERMKRINDSFKMVGYSTYAEGIIKYLVNYYTVENLHELIDTNKNLLAFNDCVFDLTIGDFRYIEKKDYISRTTGYSISQKSNGYIRDEINKLLIEIFNTHEMVSYYKYVMGSSLFGNKTESLYIHTGTGANGKGLLGEMIARALGNYHYETDNKFLTEFKSGANSSLANARGKRIIAMQEPEGESLNTEFIKYITGQMSITTRDLYKSNITYVNLFTPHMQCNIKPKIGKLDGGIIRRLRVINYPNKFVDVPMAENEKKKDYTLKDKLTKKAYINEFMLMILEHIKIWSKIDINDIIIPEEVKYETQEYVNDNNPLKNYLDKYVKITGNDKDRIKCAALYEHYKAVNDNENEILNIKKFASLLQVNGITKKIKSDGLIHYGGVLFKNLA